MVYTANLAAGRNTGNAFNYANQALILSTADVVMVQEASVGDIGQWDTVFTSKGFTRAVYFKNAPSAGDGQAIWYRTAKFTNVQAFTKQLSTGFISWDGSTNVDKSAAAIRVSIAGRTLEFVDVHLCWSKCADSQAKVGSGESVKREAQIATLLSWVDATFGPNVVMMGDMNLTPAFPKQGGGVQLDLFTAGYHDLWAEGFTTGKAIASWGDRNNDSQPDLPVNLLTRTADIRRIDYAFLKKTATWLELDKIEIPDLRAQCSHALVAGGAMPSCAPEVVQQWDIPDDFGVRPSDHNWLKVTLKVY